MTERRLVAALLAVLVVTSAVGPVAATAHAGVYEDKLSPAAANLDGYLGYKTPDYLLTSGAEERPGFFVTYTEDDRSSLVDWIDASDERDLIAEDNSSNWILVSAPTPSVLGGFMFDGFTPRFFGDGLVARSYVDTIDVNIRLSYVEPVDTLRSESEYERPAPNALVDGAWSTEGIAFDGDVNRTNMSAVRANTSADEVSVDGAGLTAAVIDTGANIEDGEVYGNGTTNSTLRIAGAKNFITDEAVNVSASDPDWSTVQDGNGHGSWVASAIAANASGTEYDGVAPGADLLIAKALDDGGSGSTQDIVEAIEWAEANGADVISMSLGSPVYSAQLATAIEDALEGNVTLVVVAAGNSRMNPAVRYIASPADVPIEGVIGVGATTTNNSTAAQTAYFSSVGPDSGTRDFSNGVTAGQQPDVAAPGMKVVTATLTTGGTEQHVALSGTSMAAPIVTGALLLALDANPGWVNDTERVVEELEATSSPMPKAGVTEVGHGMINASNLVTGTEEDEDQAEVRSAEATGRDQANAAYSGGDLVRIIAGAGREVTQRVPS